MTTAQPSKKSDVDPNFEKQLNELQQDARVEGQNRIKNDQVKWMAPLNWAGDPFDYDKIAEAFNRNKANEQYEEAVKDPQSPGNAGDLVATTTQIDFLGTMERAFRARYTHSFSRSVALAAGRRKGHGADKGTFKQSALQYVRGILKQASG
jgi:hypothetical protein